VEQLFLDCGGISLDDKSDLLLTSLDLAKKFARVAYFAMIVSNHGRLNFEICFKTSE